MRRGAKAALSHTGALAGADAAYEAAFRRAGLLRVRELDDLFSAAEILARHPQLLGDRLAILTNGGGAGVLAADRLGDLDGRLASLSDATRMALDRMLPPTWSHGNPVDIIGDADPARYAGALDVLLDDDTADAILVMNCPTALASSTAVAEEVLASLERQDGRRPPCKPLITNWLGDGASQRRARLFAAKGIASFATPAEAIDGFMQLVRYARAQEELMRTPPSLPDDLGLESDKAAAHHRIGAGGRAHRAVRGRGEGAAGRLRHSGRADRGGARPRRRSARAGRALHRRARRGVSSRSCPTTSRHKSDVGGVRLGLRARRGGATRRPRTCCERIAPRQAGGAGSMASRCSR